MMPNTLQCTCWKGEALSAGNIGCGCGCSILLLLFDLLLGGTSDGSAGEPALEGFASIIDYFAYSRMLRKPANGTYKKNAVDCLSLLRAEESRDAILEFMCEMENKNDRQPIDPCGVWKHIACYEAYCRENPKFRRKNMDRAVDTIRRTYPGYRDIESETQKKDEPHK